MTADQVITLAILLGSTVLFVAQWLPMEVTSILTIAVLMVSGVLDPQDALSGFSSTATVTVAAMFVLSAGVMRTGAMDAIAANLARFSKGSPRRLLFLIALFVPAASAFMNNTPLVVLMIPIALSVGRQVDLAPSKMLLPIAYLASLGGTITLIGTSTNILVDGAYRSLGGPGLSMFEFAPLGIAYALVGATFLLVAGPRILPNRTPLTDLAPSRDGARYISEIKAGAGSSLVGKPVEKAFDRIARPHRRATAPYERLHRRLSRPRRLTDTLGVSASGVELIELVRDGRIYRADETRGLTVEEGDTLLVLGAPADIATFVRSTGAQMASVIEDDERTPMRSLHHHVVEAMVCPDSTINGRLVSDLALHRLYGVSVMGVQRHGRRQFEGLRAMRLSTGDVLLLQGDQTGIRSACEATRLLAIEGVDSAIARTTRRWSALVIMGAVVLGASFTQTPIVTLALVGAVLMVLTGALRPGEALASLDSASLLLLAGTIPLGIAMEQSGLAQVMVDKLVGALGHSQPIVFVSGFLFVTWILTELLSNNAVAVLLTPIAVSLAKTTGINETALIMVVVFGASASFTLPQGYQTNAMVMGPGGYRFVDYLRLGLPLSLICWATASILIPVFWPLTAP